jgi:hypothetical protein
MNVLFASDQTNTRWKNSTLLLSALNPIDLGRIFIMLNMVIQCPRLVVIPSALY